MTRKMKINGYEAVVIPANNFETDYVSRVSYDALRAELERAKQELKQRTEQCQWYATELAASVSYEEENARLREALNPFSLLLADRFDLYRDNVIMPVNICIGWLRKARVALDNEGER